MKTRKLVAVTCSDLFASILGLREWVRDYVRLALCGDLIDRVVGRYLIPGFACLAVGLVGDYIIGVVGQELKQKAAQNKQQAYMQEKLADDNLTPRITTQNNPVGSDVAGEDKRIYPYDERSGEIKYEPEFFHRDFVSSTNVPSHLPRTVGATDAGSEATKHPA